MSIRLIIVSGGEIWILRVICLFKHRIHSRVFSLLNKVVLPCAHIWYWMLLLLVFLHNQSGLLLSDVWLNFGRRDHLFLQDWRGTISWLIQGVVFRCQEEIRKLNKQSLSNHLAKYYQLICFHHVFVWAGWHLLQLMILHNFLLCRLFIFKEGLGRLREVRFLFLFNNHSFRGWLRFQMFFNDLLFLECEFIPSLLV